MACLLPGVHAQSVVPIRLSPGQAVELAVKNNLNLETAREALDIKKRKSDLVWNQFLPDLSVNGTLSRDNWATTSGATVPVPIPLNPLINALNPLPAGTPDIYGVTTRSMTLPQWHVNGALSAALTFSFALVEGIKSYKKDYEAGVISYDKAVLQVEQGIRKMYNNILLLEANTILLQDSFKNTLRQAAIAEANYNAGLAPRLTWLQAQVAVENMKPSVNDLDNNLKSLRGNFALLLGLPYDTPFELESLSAEATFIPEDVEQLISRAASEKPDILELKASIITLQSQRKALALQQFTPYLRFGWTLSTLFSPALDPFKESWFDADHWNKGGNFSITLGMSLNNLFDFTKEGQQRKDMDASLRMQSLRLGQMIRETELEIFIKINSLEKTRTTKEAHQAALDLAEQSYRLTEEAYRAGLQDFQAVQSSALALDQAKLQLMREQFNYLNDLIDLEYSLGIPFGTLSGSAK
jgi:outer membrane protein TolC